MIGISPWGYPVAGVVIVAAAGEIGLGWALSLSVLVTALGWLVLRKRPVDSVSAMPSIRPIVLAVIRRGDALLVFEGRDDFKDETFHRPLGGGIEFGETGKEALEREFREELAADIEVGERLGVLENVFAWQDRPGHEIAFVFAAEFVDRSLYQREEMKILDDPGTARWVDLAEFRQGRKILYPEGLIGLLSADQ